MLVWASLAPAVIFNRRVLRIGSQPAGHVNELCESAGLRCRRLRPVRWRGNVISTVLLKRRRGEGSCPRGLFGLPAGIPRGEALPRLCGLIRRGAQLLILGGTAPVSRGRGRACRRDRGLSSRSSDRGRGNRWSPPTNCTRCRRRTAPRPHSPSGRSRGSPGRERRIIVHWMIRYGGVLTTLLGQPV